MTGTITIPERLLEADALQSVADVAARHGLGQKLLLVCDDTTWVAAGQALHEMLGRRYDCMPHSLGRAPRALLSHCEPITVSANAHGVEGIIAVGSGTVNDVAKYAAHQLGKPYICVATAASMNGYSSANASLEVEGHKQSYMAAAPKAVVADLRVLAAAPKRMARAGLGDTLCRGTVAADRFLSHIVMGTPYERDLFVRMRAHDDWLLGHAALLKEGSMEYMQHLMMALLDAGDAMSEAGSSAVASQGEHMIVHTLEMLYGCDIQRLLHGELVAVTTVTMAHLQHKLMLSQPQIKSLTRDETLFARAFGKKLAPRLAEIYAKKLIPADRAMDLTDKLMTDWPAIKSELVAIMLSPNTIERAFMHAGLAYQSQGLGIGDDRYIAAANYAYLVRDRFTFLDLAAMNNRRI